MTDRSDDTNPLHRKVRLSIDYVLGHNFGVQLTGRQLDELAQAAIDAMQLTRQTRDVWPPEESGVPGPLHETCWQTPWVGG